MNSRFEEMILPLPEACESLLSGAPVIDGDFGGLLSWKHPASGVYLFTENGKHMYVGRSRNIRRRYSDHTRPSSGINQASFAMLIAKHELEIPAATYRNDHNNRRRISDNQEFQNAFSEAKKRILRMDFRYIFEIDNTRQALLEIYCSLTLGAEFNSFVTH